MTKNNNPGFQEIEIISRKLAADHRELDECTILIKLFKSETEIKLLEVCKGVEHYDGHLSPIHYGTTKDINFIPYSLILIGEETWEKIISGERSLPEDWNLDSAIDI